MSCIICGRPDARETDIGNVSGWLYECPRCGRYKIYKNRDNTFVPEDKRAVASHLVRNMQGDDQTHFPELSGVFFDDLKYRSLPSPAEMMDNFVRWVAKGAHGRPGEKVPFNNLEPSMSALVSEIGGTTPEDMYWIVDNLRSSRIIERCDDDGSKLSDAIVTSIGASSGFSLSLTASGWQHFEKLKNEGNISKYAFFARQFDNAELDEVFANCLCPAVKATGYELRTVTQMAGTITAIIEDEIRRCRFLIADLSDDNNGAYWEAGFAEGLGKPVIYICRDKVVGTSNQKKTHFDTSHRQTVRWSLDSLEHTERELKAIIRNTLLGDAKLSDE